MTAGILKVALPAPEARSLTDQRMVLRLASHQPAPSLVAASDVQHQHAAAGDDSDRLHLAPSYELKSNLSPRFSA